MAIRAFLIPNPASSPGSDFWPESVPYYAWAYNRLRVPFTESTAGHLGIFCRDRRRALKSETNALVEIRVLGLGLLQNGNVRIRIFPEREEILIGGFRFGLITRQCVSPTQLQMRQYADGIADHGAAVI